MINLADYLNKPDEPNKVSAGNVQQQQVPSQNNVVGTSTSQKQYTSTMSKRPFEPVPVPDMPEKPQYQAPDLSAIKSTNIYDTLKGYNNKDYYQNEVNRAKRQQTAGIVGDLANLFAQGVGLSQGQRIFSPIKSNTEQANINYNNAINRQAQNNDNYNNRLLNAQIQDSQNTRILQQNALQNAYRQYYQDQKAYQDEIKNRNQIIRDNQKYGNQWDKTVSDQEYKNKMLGIKSAESKNKMANDNRRTAIAEEKAARGGSGGGSIASYKSGSGNGLKGYDSIWLNEGKNGLSEWYFPQVSKGSVAGMYQMMKDRYPKEVSDLESTTISLGGDKQNDRLSVVKQMMQKHPELTNQFTKIAGVMRAPVTNQSPAPARKSVQPQKTSTKSAAPNPQVAPSVAKKNPVSIRQSVKKQYGKPDGQVKGKRDLSKFIQ